MDEHEFLQANMGQWRRKILNGCWLSWVLLLLAQLACIPFLETTPPSVFFLSLVLPSVLILGALLAFGELAVHFSFRGLDYILVTMYCFGAADVIWFQYDVHSILVTMMIPLLISLIYFNRRLSIYTLILSEALMVAVTFLSPGWRAQLFPFDLIAVFTLAGVAAIIMLQVLKRGRQILLHLRETSASNRTLKTEYAIMDKRTKLDGLTGLYNHVTFHDFLDHLLEYAHQMPCPPSLALIDIDNFKQVNDSFGHHAGDAVLRQVSEIIRTCMGPDDFASRYGGEEFAILLLERDLEAAHATLESLREAVASAAVPEIGNHVVTVSIGLAPFLPSHSKREWFYAADLMLYEAKKTGKNRTVCHPPESTAVTEA